MSANCCCDHFLSGLEADVKHFSDIFRVLGLRTEPRTRRAPKVCAPFHLSRVRHPGASASSGGFFPSGLLAALGVRLSVWHPAGCSGQKNLGSIRSVSFSHTPHRHTAHPRPVVQMCPEPDHVLLPSPLTPESSRHHHLPLEYVSRLLGLSVSTVVFSQAFLGPLSPLLKTLMAS